MRITNAALAHISGLVQLRSLSLVMDQNEVGQLEDMIGVYCHDHVSGLSNLWSLGHLTKLAWAMPRQSIVDRRRNLTPRPTRQIPTESMQLIAGCSHLQ